MIFTSSTEVPSYSQAHETARAGCEISIVYILIVIVISSISPATLSRAQALHAQAKQH
jgi:hypothetical protein